MNSKTLRQTFIDFFQQKAHHIVHSAPMVLKNDPTLMFTNAGMNQFKDIFLGNAEIKYKRIANTQKCLRVSGKHNDLEQVGNDTYHHTMFEMLGNWSFGDYFKKEAIEWAWEFLTETLKIDKNRLYATIFEGSKEEKLSEDNEALTYWSKFLPAERILRGSKKDNFWEMGDTGPCGPCSEIHIDIRDDDARKLLDGKKLVNKDHPLVIEIWNLVFIQYNRKADGRLEPLPLKHVDTGMGFERLSMVMQNKKSNYDTDVFTPVIKKIEEISGLKYQIDDKSKQGEIIKTAMRVVADHVRAISFAIADGQLPSNTGAGYVIRRILRRAVRYGYQSLNLKEPFIFKLVPVLVNQMKDSFPELSEQKNLIEQVIREEESSFYKTLANGLKMIDQICIDIIDKDKKSKTISGDKVFELYDTFGFPVDLTALIAKGYGLNIDENGFKELLNNQKDRSRNAATMQTGDWIILKDNDNGVFIGYDCLETQVYITRYREVQLKDKKLYQLVFNYTPFYAESGGQVGDTGYIESENEKIEIHNTKTENNLILHIANNAPENPELPFNAVVNKEKRLLTENNHTATHLLHFALRKVLGEHVEQKGSFVNSDYIRFDFSHFQKLSVEEISKVEKMANSLIRQNIELEENRNVPINEAQKMGAMALFGEKYGEVVRVIKFGESIELCGGTHVRTTGQIGIFKIVSESAIAAGIRRIEAITGEKAELFFTHQSSVLNEIKEKVNKPDALAGVLNLIAENESLNKKIESLLKEKTAIIKTDLKNKIIKKEGINIIHEILEIEDQSVIKDIAFQLKNEIEDLYLVLGTHAGGKVSISLMISDSLIKKHNLHAGNIIREAAKEILGGGGGQPFYATAGGKKPEGLKAAIEKALKFTEIK